MWNALVAWLTWLAADPAAIPAERPRCVAAVHYAYASMAPAADVKPPADECACGGRCVNGRYKPDGRIDEPCPCPATCACKSK